MDLRKILQKKQCKHEIMRYIVMMMSLFSSVRYGNRNPRFGNKILAGGGTVGHSGVLHGTVSNWVLLWVAGN